jgi:hypothetical protein
VSGSGASPAPQLQLLQQQRGQAFNGYGTFMASHPNLMYAARDVAFYPGGLGADYAVPYAVPHTADKPQTPGAGTSDQGGKADNEGPPAKVSRTSKKGAEKPAGGSTYASRHQAAESRRRQRINDRCGTNQLQASLPRIHRFRVPGERHVMP